MHEFSDDAEDIGNVNSNNLFDHQISRESPSAWYVCTCLCYFFGSFNMHQINISNPFKLLTYCIFFTISSIDLFDIAVIS